MIGLGSMGAGLAQAFLKSGCRVSVWNRSRDKVDALVAKGAIACDTPSEALDTNDHVVVCLSTYAAWQKIIEEHSLTDHFKDTCIIQLTTGTLDEVGEHAAMIRESSGLIADGALMCFPRQLGTSDASLLVSGDSAVLKSCGPLLRMLAPTWTNLREESLSRSRSSPKARPSGRRRRARRRLSSPAPRPRCAGASSASSTSRT